MIGSDDHARFGYYVNGIEDLNGDGLPELSIKEASNFYVVSGDELQAALTSNDLSNVGVIDFAEDVLF